VATYWLRAASLVRRSRPQKSSSNEVFAESRKLFRIADALGGSVPVCVLDRERPAAAFASICGRKVAALASRNTASASSIRATASRTSALPSSPALTSLSSAGSL
jgi:hypothetical protein